MDAGNLVTTAVVDTLVTMVSTWTRVTLVTTAAMETLVNMASTGTLVTMVTIAAIVTVRLLVKFVTIKSYEH